ncbi:MAG: ImmA/IrrE family metallo-endopeptidase [Clostridiales bacterium]|nr:ImmA/IrrE family metallo-endopeptidase [Candidatus Crickella merdequi]
MKFEGKVNICGIPHRVVECKDMFDGDCHFGQIEFKTAEIRINAELTPEVKYETLCHEIVHGVLVHTGYTDLTGDEKFVQAMGNAISQTFSLKLEPCENEEAEVE